MHSPFEKSREVLLGIVAKAIGNNAHLGWFHNAEKMSCILQANLECGLFHGLAVFSSKLALECAPPDPKLAGNNAKAQSCIPMFLLDHMMHEQGWITKKGPVNPVMRFRPPFSNCYDYLEFHRVQFFPGMIGHICSSTAWAQAWLVKDGNHVCLSHAWLVCKFL